MDASNNCEKLEQFNFRTEDSPREDIVSKDSLILVPFSSN